MRGFDEMWGRALGPGEAPEGALAGTLCGHEGLRAPYRGFDAWLGAEDPARLRRKQQEAEEIFRLTGITFNVYGRAEAEERLIPFDIIPRIIAAREWERLARGIEQVG